MISISGASKISIDLSAYTTYLTQLAGSNEKDLTVKLDARGNVKSTFMKVEKDKCTIYTGAIETEWDTLFTTRDNITNATEAFFFISALGLQKFFANKSFDMKLSNVSNIRLDDDFASLLAAVSTLKTKWDSIPKAGKAVTSTSSTTKETKVTSTPAKERHLPENTPQIEIPEDLDLSNISAADIPQSTSQTADGEPLNLN